MKPFPGRRVFSGMRPTVCSFILLAMLAFTGCGAIKINRILDDPAHFRDRPVRVDGTVDLAAGVPQGGLYQVDDGTGKIYVVSRHGTPRKGARVSVRGKVFGGLTLGDRSFGTAIREESHKVH